jgi:hypothetical protein
MTEGNYLFPLPTFLDYFMQQLKSDFDLSGGGIGIHWDELDEDISVAGLLLGIGYQTKKNRSNLQIT